MKPAALPLLIVEDEPEIARLIAAALREFGFEVAVAGSGSEALRLAAQAAPELAIIDLGLPDVDGLDLLRELQQRHPCAVIILTGRASVADRVLGLELGADDYLVKPFDARELVARVRSILRRYRLGSDGGQTTEGEPALNDRASSSLGTREVVSQQARFGPWCFEVDRFELRHEDGASLTLSAAEAELLLAFLRSPNRILRREQLVGERRLEAFDRSIDVRVSRLRRKLRDDPTAPQLIKTVYGAGYLFAAPVEWR